jgi:TolB-like protein
MNTRFLPVRHEMLRLIVSGAGRKRVIRSLNIWWAAWTLVVAASFAAASGASAQEAKRVAVLDFTGTSASAVQSQIMSALKEQSEVELVSGREVKSTSSRLGNSLSRSSDFKEVGEALDLSAFIEGDVEKKGHRLQATVRVRDASTGSVVHEETWSRRPSGLKTIKPQVWVALGPAIGETSAPAKPKPAKTTKPSKTKPPPPPPPEEEEEQEDEEEEVPVARSTEEDDAAERKRARQQAQQERERERAREEEEEEQEREQRSEKKKKSGPDNQSASHPALVAFFGPRIMWRTLQYEGSPSSTNFQTYSSSDEGTPSFNLALGARWFPGAHKRSDWLSDIGLDFDLDYALGLKAKVAESNKKVSVSAYELGIGAIYRIPLDSFVPFVRLGFVKHVFDVDLPTMPGLSYSNIRIGAGTSINLVDWLAFDVNFAYLLVLGAGELEDANFGEDVSTTGWEAGGGALVRFNEVWGARLALDYRRYKYDFGLSDNPGTVLPKSGTDGYLRLSAAVVFTLPGEAKK